MFDTLSDRLQSALGEVRGRGKLDEESVSKAMREIRLALLEADVNFKVVKDFVARVKARSLGLEMTKGLTPGQQVVKIVHDELTDLMGSGGSKIAFAGRPPTVILLAGLQGAGKTTAVAKLALLLRKEGHTPALVAADLQRPAAVDDFLSSYRMLRKMGSLKRVLSMIPGMGKQLQGLEIDESQMGRAEAIVLSMTPKERRMPHLIDGSRRTRIAAGSGTSIQQGKPADLGA